MDFKELLIEAGKKHQEAVKQSQQIKRINTNFTTPAAKERSKSDGPKSEALQKLLDEKKREERRKREAEERKRREKEKARQEREREEKRKNTFRIPKKSAAPEDPPSDAESFSSISSGDESSLNKSDPKHPSHQSAHKSSSSHNHSEKPQASSSHSHSEKKDGSEKSHKSSSHSEKKDKHSHKSSEVLSSSSHSSSSKHNKSRESSSKRQSDHRSESENKTKHHSETDKKHRPADAHRHFSDGLKSSSKKDKSSDGHSLTSEQKSMKNGHLEHKDKNAIIKDNTLSVVVNNSSGYITSPDISSEEELKEEEPRSKPTKNNKAHHTNTNQNAKPTESKPRTSSMDEVVAPVKLVRHHLKPTKDRLGCSSKERDKILARLEEIKEKMEGNESGPGYKRASWGEVKKRRSKREKLEGDFSGSCMQKINYDEEEKPSLKRPEPKPEETKEKPTKEKKEKKRHKEKEEKIKHKKHSASEKFERNADSKGSGKVNRFDAMHEKTKVKPRPRPPPGPPPMNFAELMKLAEQKQDQPVMVDVVKPKKKESRPLTQEELDRKIAREERVKTKEFKDWYKFGNSRANAKQSGPEKTDSSSGGFLRPSQNVVPAESGSNPSKSFSIPRKGDKPSRSATRPDQNLPANRPAEASTSSVAKSNKPHSSKPGMVANKPRPQHSSRDETSSKEKSSSRDASQPRPETSGGGGRAEKPYQQRNAWESLFSRPEYKKMTEDQASKKRKRVIDSEEEEEDEDDYDDDLDDFIDDGGDEEMGSVSNVIRDLFGYDKRKYRDEDDDDRNMEASFRDVMKEEARSARLGLQEDLEDIRQEQEELRQKALKKKMRKS